MLVTVSNQKRTIKYDIMRHHVIRIIRDMGICTAVIVIIAGGMLYVFRLRQDAIVNKIQGMGGSVWNVDFDHGGAMISQRPSWIPTWAPQWTCNSVPRRINYIDCAGIAIGDDEIDVLMALHPLEGLNVSDSGITDSGLLKLQSCKRLRELQLYGKPTVSDGAVEAFQAVVPKCRIIGR